MCQVREHSEIILNNYCRYPPGVSGVLGTADMNILTIEEIMDGAKFNSVGYFKPISIIENQPLSTKGKPPP